MKANLGLRTLRYIQATETIFLRSVMGPDKTKNGGVLKERTRPESLFRKWRFNRLNKMEQNPNTYLRYKPNSNSHERFVPCV
jgi:hypothetical protein